MLNVLRPLLLLAAISAALPVSAQDAPAPSSAPPIEVRSQREDAGARVRQVERAGGRVLQAEPMQRGGREVYRFKVLTPEGRVRVVQGDPRELRDNPLRRDDLRPAEERRFDDRFERRRDRQPGFDRQSELTARRRDAVQDARSEQEAGREMRPPPPAPRDGGRPARD